MSNLEFLRRTFYCHFGIHNFWLRIILSEEADIMSKLEIQYRENFQAFDL